MINQLFKQVSIVPLVIFRIMFGILVLLEFYRMLINDFIETYFIKPSFTFPFIDFPWLQPLPGNGMYWYFMVMALSTLFILIGLCYRIASIVFFLLWGGMYLMQKSYNSDYYYLILLLSLFFIFVPANKKFSLDCKLNSRIEVSTCYNWCIWIFTLQISLLYFYAGVAKLYPDWLNGRAVSTIFKYRTNYFLIGPLLAKKWFQWFITYAGLLFDLLIVPALIWSKTRKIAFVSCIVFHLFNSAILRVGLFPYMSLALSIFYFPPEQIKKTFSFLVKNRLSKPYKQTSNKKTVCILLLIWTIFQITLPLRHFFYKDWTAWTEEGGRLSWRVMFRMKGGTIEFLVKNRKTQQTEMVNPKDFLTDKQVSKVAIKPDMCWQFVQFLKKHYKEKLDTDELEIYAISKVSLNGRQPQPLYNPLVDLTRVKWKRFYHSEWLVPLIK